ncbi:MAG TPA: methyltransferase domain-containing protein [Chitinophagaceae bacterium]|nr:methyltransferase domain-containing protein [Chitinophagaceae bacterium]
MIDLSHRSYQKEIMDQDNIPFADIEQTLKELNTVNTRLGGHAITRDGVKQLMKEQKSLLICEIGCGGGDNLVAIHRSLSKNNITASFIGIDMNPECIAFARRQYPNLPCQWILSDYALADLSQNPPDIIFSSLFCHHFTDEQLVFMLQWLKRNSKQGFFINDLHRHWLAYYLIKYITKFFSKSYLVKNDACLSVARSFRKKEWQQLFLRANIPLSSIRWRWAFRWLVIGKNQNK